QQKIYRQQKDKEDNEKLVFRIVIVGIVVILLYASGIFTTKEEASPAVEEAPAVDAAAVSEDAPAAESETPTNLQEYWHDVSEYECTNGGGEMIDGVCMANWDKAGQICSSLGGRLPTIDELRNVVTECGGVVGDHENNKNNQAYQSCYKNKGFSSSASSYLSSSPGGLFLGSSNAWHMDFLYGNDIAHHKSLSYFVRCVHSGQ
ncbi:MAG: hypothetical protein PHW18_12655, partial [Sulfuricurvum sp.]